MLDANVETDTSSCVMAVSLDLTDQALPTADEINIQLIGVETGTVYTSVTVEDGGLDLDLDTPEQPIAAQMPHMVTFDGLALVYIPETTDGEMMLVSIVLTEGDFVIDLTIPGIFVPGCGGGIVDIPCDVDATFAAFETPCGVITVIAAPEPSAVETWTLNGAPYVPTGDPHAFTLTLADGVHTLCRTVTSLLFPNCSDTYCHTFAVDCAVDSCDYSFTHESMAYGPVNTSLTYTEDHIDLHFAPFDDGLGGGPSLGNAFIDYAIPGIGTNQVLLLSNINADYDLTSLVNVSRVTFDYFDGAGIENLMVNGDFIINEFGSLYGSSFTLGGVDVFITRVSASGYDYGEVIFTGSVQSFAVGGQQFYVDDVCVSAEGVICTNDQDEDGICDEDEVPGCTNPNADNYDSNATDEDGSCTDILGCTDSTACNFNPYATSLDPNLPCLFPVAGYNCLGECIQDLNGNGICDFLEVSGCTDPDACNYNPNATSLDPNLPCLFPVAGYNCLGECIQDLNENGICDFLEVQGCTLPAAENYNPQATVDDGSCILPGANPCPTDINGDGVTSVPDLLELLGQFSAVCDE